VDTLSNSGLAGTRVSLLQRSGLATNTPSLTWLGSDHPNAADSGGGVSPVALTTANPAKSTLIGAASYVALSS
jgi:hypothetical protein